MSSNRLDLETLGYHNTFTTSASYRHILIIISILHSAIIKLILGDQFYSVLKKGQILI